MFATLATALLCSGSVPAVSRRFAIGAGLSAAALPTLPAVASNAGAAKYASGYVEPPKPTATVADIKLNLYTPFSSALANNDWQAVGRFYADSATLVNGVTKGVSPSFVKGADIGAHFAGRGLSSPSISIGSIILEGEFLDVAHVTYNLESAPGAKPISGLQRAVRDQEGKWRIDEDVFPLENGKVYGMLKPQRNLLTGKVFLALDSALKF